MLHDPVKVEDTLNWFRKAEKDLAVAILVLQADYIDESLFHCQQAVEKCLKGYLFWHGQPFKKTHDLNLLSIECTAIDFEIQAIILPVLPLTQFAVEYRYPGPVTHPSKAEATEWLDATKAVCAAIADKLPFPIN